MTVMENPLAESAARTPKIMPASQIRGPSVALGFLLGATLLVSGGLIVIGLYAPAITVKTFYVFSKEYSLIGGILDMFRQGQPLLGGFVFTVTVIFPLAKIVLGLLALVTFETFQSSARRTFQVLSALAKWSMVDVFAIALLVMVINGKVLTSADLKQGVALFAAGVLLSTLAIHTLDLVTGGRLKEAK